MNHCHYFAKTEKEKANMFCNYFCSVFNIEGDSSFDKLPMYDNMSSMSSITFECIDIT